MRFLVSEIRNAGRLERNESIDPALLLGKPPEFVQFRHPLQVSASAVLTGNDIVVSGRVSTRLNFTCGRCLEEFDKAYAADFQQVFSADQKEIDISADVQEVVFIDLPLIPVCRDDCKGLCSSCGRNKNVQDCGCKTVPENPKWSALKEFRFTKQ